MTLGAKLEKKLKKEKCIYSFVRYFFFFQRLLLSRASAQKQNSLPLRFIYIENDAVLWYKKALIAV
jgi:hypothetical protein